MGQAFSQLGQTADDGGVEAAENQMFHNFDADDAAADDDTLAHGLAVACEDVDIVDGIVTAGQIQLTGVTACCDNQLIGLQHLDQCGGDGGVHTNIHNALLQLTHHVVHGEGKVFLVGCHACQTELTAQYIGLFAKHNLVAALCQCSGSFHAADTAPCHQNQLGSVSGLQFEFPFSAHSGVAQAGNVLGIGDVVSLRAGLVAADAVADVVKTAFLALLHDVGVGDVGMTPCHEVGTLCQCNVCQLGATQTANCHNGHIHSFTEVQCVVLVEAEGDAHVGYFVNIALAEVAAGYVQYVHAQLLGTAAEFRYVVNGQTVEIALCVIGVVVLGDDAHKQGLVFGPVLAGFLDAHEGELHAVFQASAVLVGAGVEVRRQELVQQVVVTAVDFNGIEAALLRTAGSSPECCGNIRQLFCGDGLPAAAELVNGGHYTQLGDVGVAVHNAFRSFIKLDADFTAHSVDGFYQTGQTGDELVIGDAQCIALCGFGPNRGTFRKQQGSAALGALHIIVDHAVGDHGVLIGHQCAHGGHDDAVGEGHAADGDGAENMFTFHRYTHSLPCNRNHITILPSEVGICYAKHGK